MRKIAFLTVMLLIVSQGLSATTYRLFVHGRSGDNHCRALTSTSSGTSDYRNYWGGAVKGLQNVRYVGFDGTRNGGAYSWDTCGAQKQLNDALRVFCTGSNDCEIYTHSTGGLVVAAYFGLHNPSGVHIRRIQLMASAAGGSELADISTRYLGWLGFDTLGGELDQSVSTRGARNGFNHYQSHGRTFYTTSGEGTDYFYTTSAFLPGHDDGVLANHSLCNVNKVKAVKQSCTRGNGRLSRSYRCGFLWLKTCHDYSYRWSPYYTVYAGGSGHSHRDANSDYNRR